MAAPPIICFDNVSKFHGPVRAVDGVSLDIREGEFFALLGPSGCGKTSLLRLVAGLEMPSAGRVLIDGVDVAGVPANRRPVNMVFQGLALFPHMTVAENIGYGLKVAGVAPAETADRVADALALVKLVGLGQRRPDQLSGGQRQRVALARALIKRPRVLLLDEPLSALDAKLREAMRAELAQLQADVGITFLMVTHDQDEALAMADRCAVLNHGRVEQVAAPAALYEMPASRFVADFIGGVNVFEGRLLVALPGPASIAATDLDVPLRLDITAPPPGTPFWVALRPERIALYRRGPGDAAAPVADTDHNHAAGIVRHIAYRGSASLYHVALGNGRIVQVLRPNGLPGAPADFVMAEPVWLTWAATAPTLLFA